MLHHSIGSMLKNASNANLLDTGLLPVPALASGLVLGLVLLISPDRCGTAT
jgi:hypothetical protein